MLDLNLSGNNTYEVAEALVACHVPLLFSTGNDLRGINDEYRDKITLRKPFTDQDLERALTRLLSQ